MSYTVFEYILEEIALLWGTLAFLRFFLQRGGMPMNQPFARLSMKLTQWIVKPVRRLVKPVRGWDAAIVVAVFLVCVVARYVAMFTGLAINPSWFRPSFILLELSWGALLTSKCLAYAMLFVMAFRWLTRDERNRGNPSVDAFHHIYGILTGPFNAASGFLTRIMHVGVFVFLLMWVLVVADRIKYLMILRD